MVVEQRWWSSSERSERTDETWPAYRMGAVTTPVVEERGTSVSKPLSVLEHAGGPGGAGVVGRQVLRVNRGSGMTVYWWPVGDVHS
jgi:hypothetical protein